MSHETALNPPENLSGLTATSHLETQLSVGSVLAPIVSIENVAPLHFQLSFTASELAARAQAGQFVHILPRSDAEYDPFLRRAFSIMRVREEVITVLFRVEGRGTRRLSSLQKGDAIDVIGPLGRPFDLTPFHVKQSPRPLLVGGGVGVPPLIFLAQTLAARQLRPVVFIGARTLTDVLGEGEFAALGLELHIATDDGSAGHGGLVTDLVEQLLNETSAEKFIVYTCGPFPMLKAVARLAARHGVSAQASMEENMPCGIGVCNGCVVAMKTRPENRSDYGRYRRICIEGPAVWADEIDWGAH